MSSCQEDYCVHCNLRHLDEIEETVHHDDDIGWFSDDNSDEEF